MTRVNNSVNSQNQNIVHYTLPTQYTLPGVVQYLQHEWNKFDMEKAQWELEKNQLKDKLAKCKEELVLERTLRNNLEFKVTSVETSLREKKIEFHKLKFGEDSVPEELIAETNNANETAREFLFPIERVDVKLKMKLADHEYELTREELNRLIKIVFDKMTSLNVLYFQHKDYANAAKSILVSYPHLEKFDSISERLIREKLRARFSALRSRESRVTNGSNQQIAEAREKYTPSRKKEEMNKRKSKELLENLESSGDEHETIKTPYKNRRQENANASLSPSNLTNTASPHNTRSKSSITITKVARDVNLESENSLDLFDTNLAVTDTNPTNTTANNLTTNGNKLPAPGTTTETNTPTNNNINNNNNANSTVIDQAAPIVNLTQYQAQPTIRISDSILKIINEENEIKKKKILDNNSEPLQ
jgi:hypothetical protein